MKKSLAQPLPKGGHSRFCIAESIHVSCVDTMTDLRTARGVQTGQARAMADLSLGFEVEESVTRTVHELPGGSALCALPSRDEHQEDHAANHENVRKIERGPMSLANTEVQKSVTLPKRIRSKTFPSAPPIPTTVRRAGARM